MITSSVLCCRGTWLFYNLWFNGPIGEAAKGCTKERAVMLTKRNILSIEPSEETGEAGLLKRRRWAQKEELARVGMTLWRQ